MRTDPPDASLLHQPLADIKTLAHSDVLLAGLRGVCPLSRARSNLVSAIPVLKLALAPHLTLSVVKWHLYNPRDRSLQSVSSM